MTGIPESSGQDLQEARKRIKNTELNADGNAAVNTPKFGTELHQAQEEHDGHKSDGTGDSEDEEQPKIAQKTIDDSSLTGCSTILPQTEPTSLSQPPAGVMSPNEGEHLVVASCVDTLATSSADSTTQPAEEPRALLLDTHQVAQSAKTNVKGTSQPQSCEAADTFDYDNAHNNRLLRTPVSKGALRTRQTPKSEGKSAQHFETPQIGTTLLRRESLRSRTSPRKNGTRLTTKSPYKIPGLKKRDTLQEREILHQFNAATAAETTEEHAPDPFPSQGIKASTKHTEQAGGIENGSKQEPQPEQLGHNMVAVSVVKDIAASQETESSPGSARGPEHDMAHQTEAMSPRPLDVVPQQAVEIGTVTEMTIISDVEDLETDDAVSGPDVKSTAVRVIHETDVQPRQTRSAGRFSDDTSMLQDFVTRAQAKKAAKDSNVFSAGPREDTKSLRRSPRKNAASSENESPSARQTTSAVRPGTPPRSHGLLEIDDDEADDPVAEPASTRRSMRSRLPAPSKTPPGAPNFIPLRRGDGVEPVILQKSHAQDVAIVTRANTRRNKGQAKPPPMALLEIPGDTPKGTTASSRLRRENEKTVSWAAHLALYQDSVKAVVEEAEEARPRVRRVRGLGAANGTPAKKISTVSSSLPTNGTPAPKRRGRLA